MNIKKFYKKIEGNPYNVRFKELRTFLDKIGFKARRSGKGSSHIIYKMDGVKGILNIQEDKNREAKYYQVQQVVNFIKKNNLI
ncbi:MAG: type II toxin-antitoxin system HicA family toxin [Candidatus Eremiobacteraeota bacterium]|nr:type II toxin-antitoxin system HicA family toxin [Candidatus Eremiobacteraeota bacterium]